jgi:hypothetical protein
MQYVNFSDRYAEVATLWTALSEASKVLIIYGFVMALALVLTFVISYADERTIRDVGIWVKPMKFMAATALFAWTTVWLVCISSLNVDSSPSFNRIAALLISTSLFEVLYITYQGSQGLPSHYNNTDSLHIFLFGLMGIAAVGLTFSQAWLAWAIWQEQRFEEINVVTLGVLIGLFLTFFLGTFSGFLLGGNQPPAGQGLPIVGWHLQSDIRPAHFLGIHAQQFIPLLALFADRYLGNFAFVTVIFGSCVYLLAWISLVWIALCAQQ